MRLLIDFALKFVLFLWYLMDWHALQADKLERMPSRFLLDNKRSMQVFPLSACARAFCRHEHIPKGHNPIQLTQKEQTVYNSER